MAAQNSPIIGLVLTGGGARAAYQVGVLRAIAKMLPRKAANPFQVICGTSAGAINAVALAIDANNFPYAVRRLTTVWKNFRTNQVYRTDVGAAVQCSFRLLSSLVMGGQGRDNPVSVLDNAPLRELLQSSFDFGAIQGHIDAGCLHAISVTASGYTSGQSVCFFQGNQSLDNWKLARRAGARVEIGLDHLLASTAIPFLFPPVRVNREYFGDGSMRQIAPISSAIHLGAAKILVIAGGRITDEQPERIRTDSRPPSLAQISGHVLNGIFLDSLEVDLERLTRINNAIRAMKQAGGNFNGMPLRHIDCLVFSPSQEIEKIAAHYANELPRTIHFLLRGMGARRMSGSNLISYLLFERLYCRALMKLGYRDAMERKTEMLEFLGVSKLGANDVSTKSDELLGLT
ncbi:MAG TPA: patatin-like phospholipase family protein [Burkholderiales bacterium]|nr:patatin-like phospholipase family protein [Burkholderiales bacterium]